ncbi:valyl tRNA synthetase [Heterostelium album PN500]|uniref:Valine--tRNA ligase, mitochondrial n=1 Tax=Heterostelium pallidum (strain ATCC 26659 / Pp 5 / PN500) TaxID=670386 RepID=D3BPX3_HETP5|nr:valyl tRNA synthetase [Heterostelium album PN500]EFA76256.1 valyl tRNA synthetase [Heterostelium album PN500]|eukprot:XP_020428389.1 valyl tRNA synthetase [Heterostelium album PN500]
MSDTTDQPILTEEERKKEEKKKAKEAEKEAKKAKLAEKEAKLKLVKEKELENKKKKEAQEAEQREKAELEAKNLREYAERASKTPKGEKKRKLLNIDIIFFCYFSELTGELYPSYHPPAVESAWYDWWLQNEFFSPEKQMEIQPHCQKDKKFTMVIPPPNVTGSLHLGHALTMAIQDSITRYRRMKGEVCLWIPGTDHAGIATQVVVEKKLQRERNVSRHDLGREGFINEVWNWKNEYGSRIQGQLRIIGSSLDWSREAFTMDEKRCKAVNTAFIRMFDDGLIFRSTRLVNWSCALKTAISDIEVDFKDLEKHTKMSVPGHKGTYDFGVLFEFAYQVEDSDEQLVVATTRIETMLADTAVAIHSQDPRYKHLHGKFVKHPLVNRRLPIICDDVLVDMAFGTGVVKVTPAHDHNDYETGLRHKLPMINLFTDEGLINENGGEKFQGMRRFDARNAVIESLKELGLYKGMKDNKMRLGFCSRSKDIVEPLIKPQWYVKCDGMAAKAIEAVKSGELKIIPSTHEVTWFRWLENIKDWCISRQLWWGHRIPAYLVRVRGVVEDPYSTSQWVVGNNQEEALESAAAKFKVPKEDIQLEQDHDVLDTWFSSGLFPFSTLGWPEQTKDFEQFFPTSLLETGLDILFFWVARMVMMGQQLTGKLPFNQIFLHAMVRDSHGRKMSKSLGNVIDPLDVIRGITLKSLQDNLKAGNLDPVEYEKASLGLKQDYPEGISECGTDAMRFALCAYTSQGRDINLDILRVVGYRHFCNKIWNATRFAMMKLGDYKPIDFNPQELVKDTNAVNLWILNAANRAIQQCEEGFAAYDFAQVTTAIYNFWLHDLCDFYLETTKPIFAEGDSSPATQKTKDTLYTCIDIGLKLLHPFMPYLSEELYQSIPRRPSDSIATIMLCKYPSTVAEWNNPSIEEEMTKCQDIIRAIRSLRTKYNVASNKKVATFIHTKTDELNNLYSRHASLIKVLSNATQVEVALTTEGRPGCVIDTYNENVSLLLDLSDSMDFAAEIQRMEAKKTQLQTQKDTLLKKINIPSYEKVPLKIREDNDSKLKAFDEEIKTLDNTIESFAKLTTK